MKQTTSQLWASNEKIIDYHNLVGSEGLGTNRLAEMCSKTPEDWLACKAPKTSRRSFLRSRRDSVEATLHFWVSTCERSSVRLLKLQRFKCLDHIRSYDIIYLTLHCQNIIWFTNICLRYHTLSSTNSVIEWALYHVGLRLWGSRSKSRTNQWKTTFSLCRVSKALCAYGCTTCLGLEVKQF